MFCPPRGREATGALPAFQVVCNHLAGVGIAALRFSYAGTGDSAGELTDPDRLADCADRHALPDLAFLPAGALDHTGPGRKRVDLARLFAQDGIRSVRVDIDGIGETFGRPDQPRQVPRPPEAIDDLTDMAAAHLDPDGRHLIFVGLSSGAYHAIEAGLHLHPLAACSINLGWANSFAEVDQGVVDPRHLAYRPMPHPFRSLAVKHARPARWLWRMVLQFWVGRSPTDAIAGVCRRGTPVLLITTKSDAEQFEPSVYWSIARSRLHRRGLLDVDVVSGSDHALYTVGGQSEDYPILIGWVTSRFGRAARSTAGI